MSARKKTEPPPSVPHMKHGKFGIEVKEEGAGWKLAALHADYSYAPRFDSAHDANTMRDWLARQRPSRDFRVVALGPSLLQPPANAP